MRKMLVVATVLCALAGWAVAGTDGRARRELQDIRKGVNNAKQIEDLRVLDDATIGDDLAVAGDATVGGTLGVTGKTTLTGGADVMGALILGAAGSTTVTNNQHITIIAATDPTLYLTTAAATNTITLAAPGSSLVGTQLRIFGMSANVIRLAEAAGVQLSSDPVDIGQYDCLTLQAINSTVWAQVGLSNN